MPVVYEYDAQELSQPGIQVVREVRDRTIAEFRNGGRLRHGKHSRECLRIQSKDALVYPESNSLSLRYDIPVHEPDLVVPLRFMSEHTLFTRTSNTSHSLTRGRAVFCHVVRAVRL